MGKGKLTTKQAAEKVGCPLITIQKAIQRGHLPAVKPGRDWEIDSRDLKKWNAARRGARRKKR